MKFRVRMEVEVEASDEMEALGLALARLHEVLDEYHELKRSWFPDVSVLIIPLPKR